MLPQAWEAMGNLLDPKTTPQKLTIASVVATITHRLGKREKTEKSVQRHLRSTLMRQEIQKDNFPKAQVRKLYYTAYVVKIRVNWMNQPPIPILHRRGKSPNMVNGPNKFTEKLKNPKIFTCHKSQALKVVLLQARHTGREVAMILRPHPLSDYQT